MADHLDGNALAGPLGDVFSFDVTMARVACGSCGDVQRLADALVFGPPMGLVARCPSCQEVLLRYALLDGVATLDARGTARLLLP